MQVLMFRLDILVCHAVLDDGKSALGKWFPQLLRDTRCCSKEWPARYLPIDCIYF
jgi:hypothetical protein